jgi:endonuclease YncB( thermonuclease family)
MPIFQSNKAGNATFTRGLLANRLGNPGTVEQAVTDGDTIRVRLPGGQGLRMLGCDTPEKKIEFPGTPGAFVNLNDRRWADYFAAVWNDKTWGAFKPPLPAPLKAHLKGRMTGAVTANHWRHAVAATKGLAEMIEADRTTLGQTVDRFKIFAAFAHEVLDRYGRPLVFVNADVKDAAGRPEIYNVRMIGAGLATPFFMWPNIEPFRKLKITDAAMPPSQFRKAVATAHKLQQARKVAAAARAAGKGIYNTKDPLQLHAFELRFLSRRAAPDRWVIDIGSAAKTNHLVAPHDYFKIACPEDRLFIPAEYVPLFRAKGWK